MCSKCPPCARMQAGRRGRHCLIASSIGGNAPTLRSGMTSAGQCHEHGCHTHAPAASPKSGSVPGSGQDCWLATELDRRSLVFIVYANCLCRLCQNHVTSGQVTVVSNAVLETEIFCIGISRLITPLFS